MSSVLLVSNRRSRSPSDEAGDSWVAEVSLDKAVLCALAMVWPEDRSTEEVTLADATSEFGLDKLVSMGGMDGPLPAALPLSEGVSELWADAEADAMAAGDGSWCEGRDATDDAAVSDGAGGSVTLRRADWRPTSSSQLSFSFAPTSRLWSLLPG